MEEAVRTWVDQLLGDAMDAHKRKSLSFVVTGIIESRSAVAAEIARGAPGPTDDRYKIKRVDRFLGNIAISTTTISSALLRAFNFIVGQRVLLTLDWSTLGGFEILTTSVVTGGRAIPFHWTMIDEDKTRKAIAERTHARELRNMLPPGVFFVLLFDAGFDDSDYLRLLMHELKLNVVVRSAPGVCIQPNGSKEWIHLNKIIFERGRLYDWKAVLFSKARKIPLRVVALYDHGHADPWILVTNLQNEAREVVLFYSRRFETEETYKDYKDVRAGMQLKGTRITSAERLSRLFAAQTIAYWLMSLGGLYGEKTGQHRNMQANTIKNRRVLAVWRVGRNLLRRQIVRGQHLLEFLWHLLEALSSSYGGVLCPS